MTEGTWIKFVLSEKKEKTDVYNIVVKENDCTIGQIRWFGRWRKYSFFPYNDTVWESKCLTDIVQFMNDLMQKRKDARVYHSHIKTS